MSAPAQIAVVIVSYNTRELLLACLDSAVESATGFEAEIVVVDNASSDGSVAAARARHPQARVIENAGNLGFGAACNQAFQVTNTPFILLLNSDARLTAGALRALYDSFRLRERCGAAGCRLLNERGADTANARNFLTAFNQAFELAGVAKFLPWRFFQRTCRPRVSDVNLLDCAVDWIDGACLMLRRTALDEVGFFDERFFMYSEDEDLCYRLRGRDWQVCFSAAGVATHIGGASSRQQRAEMLEQFYLSQLLFLAKHRGKTALAFYKLAMNTVLTLKRLTRRTVEQRQDLDERRRAFRRACAHNYHSPR